MKAIGKTFAVGRRHACGAVAAAMAAACMAVPSHAQSTEIPAPPQRTQVKIMIFHLPSGTCQEIRPSRTSPLMSRRSKVSVFIATAPMKIPLGKAACHASGPLTSSSVLSRRHDLSSGNCFAICPPADPLGKLISS